MRIKLRLLVLLGLFVTAVSAGEVEDLIQRTTTDSDAWPTVIKRCQELGGAAVQPLVALMAGEDLKLGHAAGKALRHLVEGKPSEAVTKALVGQLGQPLPAPVLQQLIGLLGTGGEPDAVGALTKLLDNEGLRESARAALATIGTPAALSALRDAAAKATGTWQEALLAALGHVADPGAVKLLLPELKSADPQRVLNALTSLGEIADPATLEPIGALLQSADQTVRRAAFDATLQVLGSTKLKPVQRAEKLLDLMAGKLEPYQLCGVLRALGQIGGKANLNAILFGLNHGSAQVQTTAKEILGTMPGDDVTAALQELLPKAEPARQVLLLQALAKRVGAKLVPDLLTALKSADATVQSTALELLGQVGDAKVAEPLLEQARSASDELKPVALQAYLAVAQTVAAGGAGAKALEMMSTGFELATDDAGRNLAVSLLGALGDPAALPKIMPLLSQGALRRTAAEAVMAIAAKQAAAGKPDVAVELCDRIVGMGLRDLGNLAALRLRSFGVQRDFARESGFITDWYLTGPFSNKENVATKTAYFPETEVKLDQVTTVDDQKYTWQPVHTDDVSGVVDLRGEFNPNNDVAAYAYAAIVAPQAGDALLKIGSDDGFFCWLNGELVGSFGGNRGLGIDQDVAKVKLKDGLNTLLLKITQGTSSWEYCLRITDPSGKPLAYRMAPPPFTPFVTKWQVVGPFANVAGAGFAQAYPPEAGVALTAKYDTLEGPTGWQYLDARGDQINFSQVFPKHNENVVAYAYTVIKSPAAMDATLLVGSDDGVKIWLNGEVVHSNNSPRPVVPDQDRVAIKLQAGDNPVLFKVVQGGGGWGLCARLAAGEIGLEGVSFVTPE